MVRQGRSCEQLAVDSFPHGFADSSRYKYEPQWVLRYVPLWSHDASGLPFFSQGVCSREGIQWLPMPASSLEAAYSRVPGLALSLVKC